MPYTTGSDKSKDIGCIIVDRCIDFLDTYGLLFFISFKSHLTVENKQTKKNKQTNKQTKATVDLTVKAM